MAAWSLDSVVCSDEAVGWGLWEGEAEAARGAEQDCPLISRRVVQQEQRCEAEGWSAEVPLPVLDAVQKSSVWSCGSHCVAEGCERPGFLYEYILIQY